MHWIRRAASRAACTAGKSKAISTAMIAITTRSSISVNPRRCCDIRQPFSRIVGIELFRPARRRQSVVRAKEEGQQQFIHCKRTIKVVDMKTEGKSFWSGATIGVERLRRLSGWDAMPSRDLGCRPVAFP